MLVLKDKLDLKSLLKGLQEKRPIFASEADFQLELGLLISKTYSNVDVRMEYTPWFSPNMHIDILLIVDKTKWIPIELKYKTKSIEEKYLNEYGMIEDKTHTEYYLKTHGAKNINCYHYMKDIKRIEIIRESLKNTKYEFFEGYTIFITNDSSYLDYPKEKNNQEVNYARFSLHNNTLEHPNIKSSKTELKWLGKYQEKYDFFDKKEYKSIHQLQDTYEINWDNPEFLETNNYSQDIGYTFHILINHISKHDNK